MHDFAHSRAKRFLDMESTIPTLQRIFSIGGENDMLERIVT
jgi:hypothetical protein